MSRKLSDAEFIERHRTGNRIRSERTRQRRYEAGKAALTIWVPDAIRAAITTKATNDGATLSDTATALLSAALEPTTAAVEPVDATTPTTPPSFPVEVSNLDSSPPRPPTTLTTTPTTLTTAERNQRIRELHKTGLNNHAVGRQLGCSEATVRRALKEKV